ncbi:MAG: DUF4296 domain-containing protein [Bernardetiaceae bacterium]|nr:DUF4296 domain-containing protein [Bernardetiaceae bacterium]
MILIFSHLKRLLIVLCFLLICSACSRPEDNRYRAQEPQNIMEREAFTALMADILLAEAATAQNFDFTESKMVRFEKYRDNIFEKYGIDSLDFFQNYDYYMTHPKLSELIVIRVRDSIRAKQDIMFAGDSLDTKEGKKKK